MLVDKLMNNIKRGLDMHLLYLFRCENLVSFSLIKSSDVSHLISGLIVGLSTRSYDDDNGAAFNQDIH